MANQPLTILTTGTSTIYRPAERAVVQVTVSSEGSSQDTVSQEVATTASTLRSQIETLAPPKTTDDGSSKSNADDTKVVDVSSTSSTGDQPITHWSSGSLSTGSYVIHPPSPDESEHNYHRGGGGGGVTRSRALRTAVPGSTADTPQSEPEPEPPKPKRVYTARQTFSVTFGDFKSLSTFATDLSQTPMVSISNIDWKLTAKTKQSLGTESRQSAVRDAVARARDLAHAFAENATVKPVQVQEMDNGYGGHRVMAMARRMPSGGRGDDIREELEFEPEDVEVRCSVEAKFEVVWN